MKINESACVVIVLTYLKKCVFSFEFQLIGPIEPMELGKIHHQDFQNVERSEYEPPFQTSRE